MKELTSLLLLTFSILFSTTVLHIHEANAQDVWAYSDKGKTVYVVTETIGFEENPEFVSSELKVVESDGRVRNHKIMFNCKTFWWLGLTSSGEFKYIAPIEESNYAASIWKVVKPYLERNK